MYICNIETINFGVASIVDNIKYGIEYYMVYFKISSIHLGTTIHVKIVHFFKTILEMERYFIKVVYFGITQDTTNIFHDPGSPELTIVLKKYVKHNTP